MGSRLCLQNLLEEILGSRNVYFQPPESINMKYPAIVYELDDVRNEHANDNVYLSNRRYLVTLIDANPDSIIFDKLLRVKTCSFNRRFVSDNLNHSAFSIFY